MNFFKAEIASLIRQNIDDKRHIIECHSHIKEGVWTKKLGLAKMCRNIEGVV